MYKRLYRPGQETVKFGKYQHRKSIIVLLRYLKRFIESSKYRTVQLFFYVYRSDESKVNTKPKVRTFWKTLPSPF